MMNLRCIGHWEAVQKSLTWSLKGEGSKVDVEVVEWGLVVEVHPQFVGRNTILFFDGCLEKGKEYIPMQSIMQYSLLFSDGA